MGTRLYVGNISFKATEEDLKEFFSQAGEVASVKLIKDNATGRLRGFGFVEMTADEDAQKAVTMFNGQTVGGRQINVNEARPMENRSGGGGNGFGGSGGGFSGGGRGDRYNDRTDRTDRGRDRDRGGRNDRRF